MHLTGAQIFLKLLAEEGVDTIFGYPGGAVLFLYDELYKAEARGDIRHILARHEQGAVHGAEGYAKSTDKPGVAIVTSGTIALILIPIAALAGVVTPALQGLMSRSVADDQQGELQGALTSVSALAMIIAPTHA